jgi:WD40 repeat protein
VMSGGGLSQDRPFPGLRPFDYRDHPFFFGREEQSYALYSLLELSQFVAVIGSSGSGKSSLVRAGLLPLLGRESEEDVGRAWRWIEFRPGAVPISRLADQLTELSAVQDENVIERAARRERIDFALRRSSFGLNEALTGIDALTGRSLLIVVDQFEELFRYIGPGVNQQHLHEEAAQFVQLLLESTSGRSGDVHVLITMRSDFIGDCAQFYGLPEAVSSSQFLVPSLTRDQREEVIRRPLEAAGASIDSALVERLLNDVGNDFDLLPVLQHCLSRVWDVAAGSPIWCTSDTSSRRLKLEHYNVVGGMTGALSQHADEILASLPGDDLAVEQIFRALSEVDREGRATRRALPFTQLVAEAGVEESAVHRVLDRFRAEDCSFLMPAPSAVTALTGETLIDVGHEALLRRWGRISAEPVAAVEGSRRQGGWLWQEHDDGQTYRALLALLDFGRTLPLDQVEVRGAWWTERPRTPAWADRYGGRIERVRQLFDDSLTALQKARGREIESQRAERKHLEERAAAARRNRFAAVAMSILALIAMALCVFGFIEARQAKTQRDEALLNESALLTNMAQTELANDNAELAELIARRALPTDMRNTDRPLRKESVTVLAEARSLDLLRAIMLGHKGVVSTALFSPNGSQIVTASADHSARLWDAQTGAELLVLEGHRGLVWSAAFDPDGTRIVTASEDNTARLWDGKTGALLYVLVGHSGPVRSAVFSGNGGRIVTASSDQTARLWDAETGVPLAVLQGHSGKVLSARFSPDGKRIVTASEDGTARLWDATTGAVLAVLRGHTAAVLGATFSPDGNRVLTASEDHTARIWDTATGLSLLVLSNHTGSVLSATWNHDGTRIVTSSRDETARIWNANTGVQLFALQGHADSVSSATFSPDGTLVATASADGSARLWDAQTGKQVYTLQGHTGPVLDVAFSADGSHVVTASEDNTSRSWDTRSRAMLAVLYGHAQPVIVAEFSPDGTRIITASRDNTAKLWDATAGKPLTVLNGHSGPINSAAFSPDGRRAVTAASDDTARIWDVVTGKELAVLHGHTAPVRSAVFSPDGARIVTASSDHTARLWDAASGKVLAVLDGHTGLVSSAAFSPDGVRIVTASSDRTARLWDAKTGAPLRVLSGHTAPLQNAAFSPDGGHIVTASDDNTARLWEAATGAPLLVLEGHTGPVLGAVFSPEGRRILTTSEDGTARVWGVEIGSLLAVLQNGKAPANSAMLTTTICCSSEFALQSARTDAAFSAAGDRIVTAGADRIARIWDAKTYALLAVLRGHSGPLNSAAFSPDGTKIVSASEDNTARLWTAWPLLTDDTVAYASVSATRTLTAAENMRLFPGQIGPRLAPALRTAAPESPVGISLEELRARAERGDPYAHRRLAELYERGIGVEKDLKQAVFYHATEVRLFEAANNELQAAIARARRGSDARAAPLQAAVEATYKAMDWSTRQSQ